MTYSEPPPDQRGQRPWTQYASPLRYPGGKRKLSTYVKLLLELNGLVDGEYAEPYAGGAGVALELVYEEYVRRIHINDVDRGIHAFWSIARSRPDELSRRIRDVPVTIEEWRRQRATYQAVDPDPVDLALATLYLNRTNRSGIVTGGPIGGYEQKGVWRLDARFRREDLVHRVQKVGRYGARISVYGMDAADFLKTVIPTMPLRSLVYLDPPYFVKGQEELYANFYRPDDHREIAELVKSLDRPWLVSYDDAPQIRTLYAGYATASYTLPYAANSRYRGSEVVFFSATLDAPAVASAVRVSRAEVQTIRAAVGH